MVSQYGWFVVLGLVVLVYVWTKLKPSYEEWRKKRERLAEEQNIDPVKAERYQDDMMRAREKMQQKLNEDAVKYQIKKEEVS